MPSVYCWHTSLEEKLKSKRENNDNELILRTKKGDTDAFRQLVEKHKDVSLSLACSILKDQDNAEDVLQESFIKVYQKIDGFKFKSSFPTWLYRIIVNTSYNALKKQKQHLDLSAVDNFESNYSEKKDFVVLQEKEQKVFIQMAMNRLKPDEALALRLFYLCEMKIKEIEKITGSRNSKIKVDLHRGRENLLFELKKILGKEINTLL